MDNVVPVTSLYHVNPTDKKVEHKEKLLPVQINKNLFAPLGNDYFTMLVQNEMNDITAKSNRKEQKKSEPLVPQAEIEQLPRVSNSSADPPVIGKTSLGHDSSKTRTVDPIGLNHNIIANTQHDQNIKNSTVSHNKLDPVDLNAKESISHKYKQKDVTGCNI